MAKKQIDKKTLPSTAETNQFDMIFPMLVADLDEIRELSKKKPDGILNPLKVKTINKKLEKIKALLSAEPTTEFLELLDEETLPSNSDAVFLVIQFKTAMQQFKARYYFKDDEHDAWAKPKWQTKD